MRSRHLQPELMDDPSLPADEHHAALTQLARLNVISRTARSLWPHILASRNPAGPTSIFDVATGSGDIPAALALLARRERIPLHLTACDISPVAADAARARWAAAGIAATLDLWDVVRNGLPHADASIDILTCSLFLHHLTEADATRVLSEMGRVARRCVLVSDLRRCTLGLAAAYLATRVATRSHVVRVDAIRSVRAAFTERELAVMSGHAGMHDARIQHSWPFRMLLVWQRPSTPTPLPGMPSS